MSNRTDPDLVNTIMLWMDESGRYREKQPTKATDTASMTSTALHTNNAMETVTSAHVPNKMHLRHPVSIPQSQDRSRILSGPPDSCVKAYIFNMAKEQNRNRQLCNPTSYSSLRENNAHEKAINKAINTGQTSRAGETNSSAPMQHGISLSEQLQRRQVPESRKSWLDRVTNYRAPQNHSPKTLTNLRYRSSNSKANLKRRNLKIVGSVLTKAYRAPQYLSPKTNLLKEGARNRQKESFLGKKTVHASTTRHANSAMETVTSTSVQNKIPLVKPIHIPKVTENKLAWLNRLPNAVTIPQNLSPKIQGEPGSLTPRTPTPDPESINLNMEEFPAQISSNETTYLASQERKVDQNTTGAPSLMLKDRTIEVKYVNIDVLKSWAKPYHRSDRWILVADTRILLEDMLFIKQLLKSDKEVRLRLPHVVLNYLKAMTNKTQPPHLRIPAQRVTQYMDNVLDKHILGQGARETEALFDHPASIDSVVNCCMQEMEIYYYVVLITDDPLRRQRARSIDLPCFTLQESKELVKFRHPQIRDVQLRITRDFSPLMKPYLCYSYY